MLDFSPIVSMAVCGRETGYGPTDRPADMLWIGMGAFFSQGQWICSTLLMIYERLPHTGTAYRKCTSGVRGLAQKAYMSCVSGFPLQGVYQFKSP
jgi:hypothetical protein